MLNESYAGRALARAGKFPGVMGVSIVWRVIWGGIDEIVVLNRTGVDEKLCRACERMGKSLQVRVVES